jgi:hypothetical protein
MKIQKYFIGCRNLEQNSNWANDFHPPKVFIVVPQHPAEQHYELRQC